MRERTCLNCGKTFQVPYPSSSRQNCSEECRIARLRKPDRKTRADKGTRKTKWVALTCAACGGSFDVPPWQAKNRRYCSAECRPTQSGLCEADGCDQEARCRNMCMYHYMRWYREQPHVQEREATYGRRYQLKKYGITEAEWEELLARSNGRCEICGNEVGGPDMHIDHCHTSGTVRSLLCRGCNVGLGQFEDEPARLRAAADYLERHKT